MSVEIQFTSTLSDAYRVDLERLLFFNENQGVWVNHIMRAVDAVGSPRILCVDNKLRLGFESGIRPQSLFALEDTTERLVGAVVYNRCREQLDILFVAVHEEYSYGGEKSDALLLLSIVNEIRAIGGRIKGVSSLAVGLRSGLTMIPVLRG